MDIQLNVNTIEDRLKQQTFDESNSRKNEPSQSELCETVLLLKQMMPHRSLQRAIIMLYETLVKEKSPQEVYETHGIQPLPIVTPKKPEQQVTKNYLKNDTQKKREDFRSQTEWNRYRDRRAVAKSFVGKGYGHQFAIQELNWSNMEIAEKDKPMFSYNKDVYKQSISHVVGQAFRKLQAFLSEDCKKRIVPITKAELKKLMTPLLSSSAFAEHIVTFKKFLRFLYGLSNVTFCEGETVKLYLQAMRFLNGRPITMQEIQGRCIQNPNTQLSHSQIKENNQGNWAQFGIDTDNSQKQVVKVEQCQIPESQYKLQLMNDEVKQEHNEEDQDLNIDFDCDI